MKGGDKKVGEIMKKGKFKREGVGIIKKGRISEIGAAGNQQYNELLNKFDKINNHNEFTRP